MVHFPGPEGPVYRCVDCEREVHYPDTLYPRWPLRDLSYSRHGSITEIAHINGLVKVCRKQ